jgi:hypothetical protein
MAREIDQPVLDQEARERIGNIIGSAVRHGWSQFAYDSRR